MTHSVHTVLGVRLYLVEPVHIAHSLTGLLLHPMCGLLTVKLEDQDEITVATFPIPSPVSFFISYSPVNSSLGSRLLSIKHKHINSTPVICPSVVKEYRTIVLAKTVFSV